MLDDLTAVRRGTAGPATTAERLHDLVAATRRRQPDAIAFDLGAVRIDATDLDRWSDAIAATLAPRVAAGDRVAVLFERGPHAVATMLALSKLAAAWVPLDVSFPADRLAYICADAGATLLLTTEAMLPQAAGAGVPVVAIQGLPRSPATAPTFAARPTADDTAYIVYTSGTTGRPKGVPIHHEAICAFLRAAAVYGFAPTDRVYQGLTIAFDFSVEEIWVPLVAGACLVPPPDGVALVGDELADFLAERRITALCCVPTLLATVTRDLPDLRLLLVSGESCPAGLVRRWATPGRRMLNVYGPTETTVSATWAQLTADEPVTIGVALPGYTTLVLDRATGAPVPDGQEGELAIGGVGLSRGYLGRPDLTARAFVLSPVAGLPGDRVYRTGDLVRYDEAGRLVYLGRIDTQVKVRGFRIELDEIESAILAVPGVAQAAVRTFRRREDAPLELAGFYSEASAGPSPTVQEIMSALRAALPAYMVPSSLERCAAIPMTASGKVDRGALPEPSAFLAEPVPGDPPANDSEAALAAALAGVLGLPSVGVTAHLFDDLGADSFSVARFCAAVRGAALPGVTTRLVYANPTIRGLAAAAPAPAAARAVTTAEPGHRASRLAHVATGVAQLGVYALMLFGVAWLTAFSETLIDATDGWTEYVSTVAVTVGAVVVAGAIPVLLTRLLSPRGTAPIPAWSMRYLRFWIVRTTLRFSPVRLLVGSPLYSLYLRALGARVGRHALILSSHLPVFPGLVSIGADTMIAPEVRLDGYRVEAGRVLPGPVRIGDGAIVGHGSHLDIDTAIGAGARLSHASALLEGQRVPAGRSWHGSPAIDAGAAEDAAPARRVGDGRRAAYAVVQLLVLALVSGPLAIEIAVNTVDVDVLDPLTALTVAVGVFGIAWAIRCGVPRVLALLLVPGRDYPVYTTHWMLLRAIVGVGNSPLMNELFGDSSAVVFYLRSIGVRFRQVVQTGSNFGTAQRFDLPTWCSVGGGTLISDGLAMTNAEFTPHSFRVRPSRIGDRVFMGNGVVYPAGAAVGDDCLLATKVLVPLDGPVRAGVGLLGSPAFEVPRTVRRDAEAIEARPLAEALGRKNRHNAVTAVLFLAQRFVAAYIAVAFLIPADASDAGALWWAFVGTAASELALLVVSDWAVRGLRRLRPATCTIHEAPFWRHERYWKLADPKALAVFDGTPIKPLLWRLLGVRVGRMLLDDGVTMPERSLVTIGDHVTLGARSTLHGHSLEDGVFKSDTIAVGDGASVGPSALVHYGAVVGRDARIASDAFVMKGEHVGAGEVWAGNPAGPVR